jgi:phosphatidylserine/phosphatidylglycerophosphate/cardiolipin synthase-like enzyme
MQSSNQPDVDSLDVTLAQLQTNYNREWHVIVEHRKLASVYEKFIKQDMKQAEGLQFTADSDESDDVGVAPPELLIPIDALSDAEADESPRKSFPPKTFKFTIANPLSVHQLLTPDNFAEAVAPVIRKAKKKLYFQNQYIKVNEDPSKQFESLLDAVLRKVADGLEDVRIILRKLPNSAKELEALQYYALENYKIEDLSFIRYQPGSHTKGIIVDSKNVVIGSHNWSNSGVTNNRDASLIFFNADIAQYYEEVFLYDFDKLAKPQVMSDEEMPLVSIPGPVDVESDSESNLVNVPWDYFEDAG